MATYNNEDYASKGVGTAGLTLGVIGTALASGILNGNGLGGLFGNNNPATSAIYQLSQKDNEIAQLKSEKYTDNKFIALSERVANLEARVLADEKTDPLRDQILGDRIAGLASIVNRISAPMVPNYVLAPGYGPAMVAPLPPPFPPVPVTNGGTAATPKMGERFLGFAALGALKNNPMQLVNKVKPWMEMAGIVADGMVDVETLRAALAEAFENVPKVSYFGFTFGIEDAAALLKKMQDQEVAQ